MPWANRVVSSTNHMMCSFLFSGLAMLMSGVLYMMYRSIECRQPWLQPPRGLQGCEVTLSKTNQICLWVSIISMYLQKPSLILWACMFLRSLPCCMLGNAAWMSRNRAETTSPFLQAFLMNCSVRWRASLVVLPSLPPNWPTGSKLYFLQM